MGSCVQLYSLAETQQLLPSPRIWAHMVSHRRHLFVTLWHKLFFTDEFESRPTAMKKKLEGHQQMETVDFGE
jgi:hypothetical protein